MSGSTSAEGGGRCSPQRGRRGGGLLLDGAMGTALIDAGLPPGCLPEAWLVTRPEAIAGVHAAHAAAGAEVVLTCTFNLASPRLPASGVESSVGDLARRAVALARAAAPGARVAGALGPTLLHAAGEMAARYAAAFGALAQAGCDLLWAETQLGLEEALAALAAARATGLPAVVTFAFRELGGSLRSSAGEPALDCLEAAAGEGAVAVGANCALPGSPLALVLAAAEALAVPLVAKPSAGLPGAVVTPEAFGSFIGELVRAGASWVGGCCGAGDAHLRAAARQLHEGVTGAARAPR